ncbi:MAG TPA: hypothetical protein PKY82_35865, partial [Pyrinomonadaceae bacterium]|nr:hypothetical protein [Pyrinomonadaceae bacterium]
MERLNPIKEQTSRQEFVDQAIFALLQELVPAHYRGREIEWDQEMIAGIRECLQSSIFLSKKLPVSELDNFKREFYPVAEDIGGAEQLESGANIPAMDNSILSGLKLKREIQEKIPLINISYSHPALGLNRKHPLWYAGLGSIAILSYQGTKVEILSVGCAEVDFNPGCATGKNIRELALNLGYTDEIFQEFSENGQAHN